MRSSLQEESRVVIIRFGHDGDDTCMQMDETLASVADKMKNFAVVYLVDITEVPDFNAMYELYDPCTVMFFFRNRVRWWSRLFSSPGPPPPLVHPTGSPEARLRATTMQSNYPCADSILGVPPSMLYHRDKGSHFATSIA